MTYGMGAFSVGAGMVAGAGAGAGAVSGPGSGAGVVVAGELAQAERIPANAREPNRFLVEIMNGWSS